MSEFFIGKYAIGYIQTELSSVIRKKDVCEFHHVFRRDRESNQVRTDRMSRKVDYLFVMPECTFHVYLSHLRIQCIVMELLLFLFKEHFFSNNYPLISFTLSL